MVASLLSSFGNLVLSELRLGVNGTVASGRVIVRRNVDVEDVCKWYNDEIESNGFGISSLERLDKVTV